MIRFTPLAAVALAASLAANLAAAAHAADAVRVSYRDLDLSTVQGQAVLAHRLHRAADTLCFAGKTRELGALTACRSDVMASIPPLAQLALAEKPSDAAPGNSPLKALR